MKNAGTKKRIKEHGIVAKLIFKGYKIDEIAKELNYSKSTVRNRINDLFKKYNAKNMVDFILGVMGEIIENNKILIAAQEEKIRSMSQKIEKLEGELKKSKA